jgi:hypothetical protein
MVSTRWKFVAIVLAAVAVTFVAIVLAAAVLVVGWFFEPEGPDYGWPEMHVPSVEQWAEIPLTIDPNLHCPTPVICRGGSHRGPSDVAPYEPCCDWHFDVTVTKAGKRSVHLSSGGVRSFDGDEYNCGETFDFVVDSGHGGDQMRVFGRAFKEDSGEKPLQGLFGVVTVNTLEWREHEPVHVHFELGYYYDDDPTKWSTIEVCADAPVRLKK